MILRPYQSRSVLASRIHLEAGRNVCLVAPTGSGKTVMGATISSAMPDPVLWVSHRQELQAQAQAAAPWVRSVTVQSVTDADLAGSGSIVLDECHHYRAADWERVTRSGRLLLGLTATPQRPDGKALGRVFSELVVAATYSELIASGHLVDCHVYSPQRSLGRDLAMSPIDAYRTYCDGRPCFAFFGSVKQADEWSTKLSVAGIPSGSITGNTDPLRRAGLLSELGKGLLVICSVQTMTEGVDIPAVSAVMIARSVQHASVYLQMAGRALRPSPGKEHSVLVDLTGSALLHGSPTADRVYSLDGRGIEREQLSSIRNCLQCGRCYESSLMCCPRCGYKPTIKVPRPPRIYSLELRKVYDGSGTPDDAKLAELLRLCSVATERGYRANWVSAQYRHLFGYKPDMSKCSSELKALELSALRKQEAVSRYKRGFAFARYKAMFGRYP